MPSNINITGNVLPALAHVLPYLPMCPLAWDKLQLLVTNVLQPLQLFVSAIENTFSVTYILPQGKSLCSDPGNHYMAYIVHVYLVELSIFLLGFRESLSEAKNSKTFIDYTVRGIL